MAAPGRGGGPVPRVGGEFVAGAAGRAIRRRRLREFCPPRAVAGSRVFLADRTVRAGDTQAKTGQLAGALSVDRPGGPAVLPEPREPCASRRGIRIGLYVGSLRYASAAGASHRDPAIQAGCAVADERCHGPALWGCDMSADPMDDANPINGASIPAIDRRFRLQWEAAQNAHVLLYPEGMIKLNTSAGEILKRCDGATTIADITADLERAFAASNLSEDVIRFVHMAVEKQWLKISS